MTETNGILRGEEMKVIFKSIVLVTMVVVLVSIWVPNFITGSVASADDNAVGSTIGGVEVGNLKDEELEALLTNAVNEWSAQNLIVTGGETAIEVSSSTFLFDIESTVENYNNQVDKPWYAFWKDRPTVHLPLIVFPSEIVRNEIGNISTWDTELTYSNVELNASYLKGTEVEAVVIDVSGLEIDRISLSIEPMPEGAMGVNELIYALHDTVIEPQTAFSMLERLGDSVHLANSEAINFIASNIYNAALNINAEILERHSQNDIPSYLKPGLEAKVDVLALEDLKFANTFTNPVMLKLTIEEENLKTEVYTPAKETDVEVTVSEDEEIQPRTIIRYSPELAINATKEIQQGIAGVRVSVYRLVYDEQKLVSRDYYPPVDRIIVKSSQEPEPAPSMSDISNDPAYQVDLDGDGFPDDEVTNGNPQSDGSQNDGATPSNNGSSSSGGGAQNSNSNTSTNNNQNADSGNAVDASDSDDDLPPGSYYDKGGNLITP